eukprot:GEZU01027500.1.p1 GENE.GEZU01027500.1~~GEZU01027500.1.p1  ORF type:complete len:263 (-),score=16.58 GEZU01027500.1:741-1529(-)
MHCDIKEDNVLFDASRRQVVLIDFEYATTATATRKNDEPSSGTRTVVGTEGYIAPELFNPFHFRTYASDIFSAGVLLSNLMLDVRIPEGTAYRDLFQCSSLDEILRWRQQQQQHQHQHSSSCSSSSNSHTGPELLPPTWNYDIFVRIVQPMLNPAPSKRPTAAESLKHREAFGYHRCHCRCHHRLQISSVRGHRGDPVVAAQPRDLERKRHRPSGTGSHSRVRRVEKRLRWSVTKCPQMGICSTRSQTSYAKCASKESPWSS